MYVGHVFLCASKSVRDCLKHKLFTCSDEDVVVVREMGAGSIVFLLNADSGTLVGPFTAAGLAKTALEPGGKLLTRLTKPASGWSEKSCMR